MIEQVEGLTCLILDSANQINWVEVATLLEHCNRLLVPQIDL